MKSSILKSLRIISVLLLLSGCAHVPPRVVNLTPARIPTNPSGIYTLTVMADEAGRDKVSRADVIIGGERFAMARQAGKAGVFVFDYAVPPTINHARYYFELFDGANQLIATSDVFDLRLSNRYIVELGSRRAQPGTPVSVLGGGFRAGDEIVFNGRNIETRFISSNLLEFDVPAVEGGRDYQVALSTQDGEITVSRFRVDFSELRSVPSRLVVMEGQTATLLLAIDREAPHGGVELNLKLSHPHLLELEPVSIAQGSRSVHVPIMGGLPGTGTLTVRAPAHNEIVIPVLVESRLVDE